MSKTSSIKLTEKKVENKMIAEVLKISEARKLKIRNAKELTKNDRDFLVIEFREQARKLARSILRKWRSRLDLDELNSAVDLSLCEAVKRYDPTRGASFITFLYYHLRGNLIRTVSYAANANVVPGNEPGRELSEDETAMNAMDIANALTGAESISPDEALLKKQLVKLSFDACHRLDDLEREVIQRIFVEEHQLNDVAASLGYSRCHISRVKRRALETLNQEMEHVLESSKATKDVIREARIKFCGSPIERRRVQRRKPRAKKD